jgi:hypothetical protein
MAQPFSIIPVTHRAPGKRYLLPTSSYPSWSAFPQENVNKSPQYPPMPPSLQMNNQSRQTTIRAEKLYSPPLLNSSLAPPPDIRLKSHNHLPCDGSKTTTDNSGQTCSYTSSDFIQRQRQTQPASAPEESRSRGPWFREDHTWNPRPIPNGKQFVLSDTCHTTPHVNSQQPASRPRSKVSHHVLSLPDTQNPYRPCRTYGSSSPYPPPQASHKPLPTRTPSERVRCGLDGSRTMYPTEDRKFRGRPGLNCWFWNYSNGSCRFGRDECKRLHKCNLCGSPSHGRFYSRNGSGRGCESAQHRYNDPNSRHYSHSMSLKEAPYTRV